MPPIKALKIFMFLCVGGLGATGHHYILGGDPKLDLLIFGLAGLGAVVCVELFVHSMR
jgi:hypothetical protein